MATAPANNERVASSMTAVEMELRDAVRIESRERARYRMERSGAPVFTVLSGGTSKLSLEYSGLKLSAIALGADNGDWPP